MDILLQKIITLISTFLPYTHGHYTMLYTMVVNFGEGASNQGIPTRYCEQG